MYKYFLKRIFDFIFALIGIIVLAIPMLVVSIIIKCDDKGPALFIQKRVGKYKNYFSLYKFRTMKTSTPKDVPTHLLVNPSQYVIKHGPTLRRFSIDEWPQLFNILVGDMSFVGPRPALWNQFDLVEERDRYGANDIRPGLTGWAQVNGRDMISIEEKAKLDGEYVEKESFIFDCKCCIMTVKNALTGKDVIDTRNT